ncbi:transglycosylase domain-containing protein [Holospora curviuscula]|uniref:Penicillin-binding protein 1F n=1 Tax=Holospora curviuscula TaxID=1082868 RepID=A0A2S5R7T8_9PROT|nr:PBP1A family penicillin-binding protein [Holospora curviuscula]PPE03363.1 Penicillin-binding protein 1F [Holospora curviuscula]
MKEERFFKSPSKRRYRWVLSITKWFFILSVWGSLALGAVIIWFGYDLPSIEDITKLHRDPHILIKDRQGNILGSYGNFYGTTINVKKMKPYLVQALLATEDRRFFYHFGIDPIGTIRALLRNIKANGVIQGGSTITQQLARNFFESKKLYNYKDRSLKHKIKEAILAVKLEMKFTKEQILTMYLNRVYLGANVTGLDAASLHYFGHSACDLTLYESAILIGMLKGPCRYSPVSHYERSESRAKRVLQNMVEEGFITQEDAATAMALPSPLEVSKKKQSMCRYFTDWVITCLPELLEDVKEDIEIITTIDLNIQSIAQKEVFNVMRTRGSKVHASQMALVCTKASGEILAMLGGMNYAKSAYNRATQAKRQAGSSFKFFTFLASLDEGYDPDYLISDYPIEVGGWRASNYKHKARGEVTIRTGFAQSINAVAVRLATSIGLKRVIRLAKTLGISSELPRNYSLVLGSGEVTLLDMTGAYLVTLNEGKSVRPYGIEKIVNKQGKILYQHLKCNTAPCVSKEAIQEMRSLMHSVVEEGSGRKAKLHSDLGDTIPCGGKTGTSQRYRDVWFIGFAGSIMTGIWCGNDNEKPMEKPSDGWPTVHAWRAFNERLLEYFKNPKAENWQKEEFTEGLEQIDEESTLFTKDKDTSQEQVRNEDDEDEDDEENDEDEDEEDDENDQDDAKRENEKTKSSAPPSAVPVSPSSSPSLSSHSSKKNPTEEELIKEILSNMGTPSSNGR